MYPARKRSARIVRALHGDHALVHERPNPGRRKLSNLRNHVDSIVTTSDICGLTEHYARTIVALRAAVEKRDWRSAA
jgi:hypothetical protein